MPTSKNRDYQLTRELLQQYCEAALANGKATSQVMEIEEIWRSDTCLCH